MELKNKVSTRVQIAETGMSLRKFSSYIGISQPYLSQILKGEAKPSPTVAFKIAKGVNASIKDIFFIKTD